MADPKPDNRAAEKFLLRWAANGPWVLTAIRTDRKAIDTRTFRPESVSALRGWLAEHNGNRNIYFHVNPPIRDVDKKTDREDVKELAWLHVDIDPRAGEDIEEEQERALALLQDRLPQGVPAPTCIIFSGGGYQAFWRLKDPLPINGEVEKYEHAKLYNLQLEIMFGADNCHNVDRIMRLPGTINIPDARKAKKGRVPTLAHLVEFNKNAYPLEDFQAAQPVQSPGDTGFDGGGETVEIGGNIERVQDLAELDEWSVPDRVKIIIAQGRHPEEKKEDDNSRSAWLFDVCANLARCKVPDETIFSLITDPDWGISESVLELKSNATKYAIRQIERAKEAAIDPWLERLNSQFAVIETIGGKCRVVEEVMDPALGRPRLTLQGFDDFRNRYMHIQVQIGVDQNGVPKFLPLGKWWLRHKGRRQYNTVVFSPLRDVSGSYNMWKGFGYDSVPGECNLFLEHIHDNLCGGNKEHYDYLMGWMARMMQKPDSPGEVAIVLRGGRGTGKSFFAVHLGKLLGRHFLQVSNSSHLTGNFNAHLRDLILLFGDEAFYAGDKKHASILKTLITETTLTIERKGVDIETAPNYIHLIMASNDMHVIPAGGDERRFFVVDVSQDHQRDTDYFRAVAEQLENGGYEALLNHLLNYDLEGYQVRDVPATEALHEQKLLSMDPDQEWWYQKLWSGDLLHNREGWPDIVVFDELVFDYIELTRRFNVTRRGSQTSLGRFLGRVCPRLQHVRRMVDVEYDTGDGWTTKKKVRKMCVVVPTLQTARETWEELHGEEGWPDIEEQDDLPGDDHGKSPF